MHNKVVMTVVEPEDPAAVAADWAVWAPADEVPICGFAGVCTGAGGAMLGAGFRGLPMLLACMPLATLPRKDSAAGMCDARVDIVSAR